MSPISTVLFDLDGTLIDSIALILESYRYTMAEHGFGEVSDELWRVGIGTPLRVQLASWAKGPEDLEALVQTYRRYNLDNHDRMITVFPGVPEMVQEVAALGCRIGVVTSKTREGTLRGLRLAGLESSIEAMVCADDVENPKPHPEPVAKAVRLLGGATESTIFVGDSIHDMVAGRAAGVEIGAALWGPFGRSDLEASAPDVWLEQPAELVDFIRERAVTRH
jgi:pyrophosphatase PpaX